MAVSQIWEIYGMDCTLLSVKFKISRWFVSLLSLKSKITRDINDIQSLYSPSTFYPLMNHQSLNKLEQHFNNSNTLIHTIDNNTITPNDIDSE